MSSYSSTKIAKSGFSFIKNEKKLLMPYILSYLLGAVLAIGSLFAVFNSAIVNKSITISEFGEQVAWDVNPILSFAALAMFALIFSLIFHIAESYVVSYAIDKFRGKDASLAKSGRTVRRQLKSIAQFAALSAGIGAGLNYLEERLPFLGSIAASLANITWSIASAFAIPVIVSSEEPMGALKATTKSASIIKTSFGENVKVALKLGIITIPLVILWIFSSLASLSIPFFAQISANPDTISLASFILPGLYTVISGVLVLSFVSVLSGVTRAALFHYVDTGKAPEAFEKDMFKAMITPKKARKVFGAFRSKPNAF